MAKIDDFDYLCEKEKQNSQVSINGLLEAHGDLQHKIQLAYGAKKSGVWLEISEAEIIAGHMLECASNLIESYNTLEKTNKLLNANYKAALLIARQDIKSSIEDFKNDKINKEEFAFRVNRFVGLKNPNMAA